jgi:novel protein kinase C epsilon type
VCISPAYSYANGCVTGHQCGAEPAERSEMKLSLDNFQFIQMLCKGAFGTVVLAKRKLPGEREQLCAIKALKKKHFTRFKSISLTITEKAALILASGHPFITSLYSCFENKIYLNF